MNHSILLENQGRRLDVPLLQLTCFAMFSAWQMGFIYFMTPSLVINDRTPLPINMDNATSLIAAAYVISIVYIIFIPQFVVWAQRILTIISLLTFLSLFLPLTASILEKLIYIHIFCCCIMIGFEVFLISSLLSESSAIKHLTVAYGISLFIIAAVQNDTFPISFAVFRPIIVLMLLMQLYFYFSIPANNQSCPRYVKKGDGMLYPKHLFSGLTAIAFVSCLMMLCGPSAVTHITNGVTISYLSDGVAAITLYVLYKKTKIHPLRWITILVGFSAIGYLLLFSSSYIPALTYPACILLGFGYVPCQFLPLYALVLLKHYPSRYIVPVFVSMALITVVFQSILVEIFRNNSQMLLLNYLLIMVVLAILYIQLEPFLVLTFLRKIPKSVSVASFSSSNISVIPEEVLLSQLTSREREVLELISFGYSNGDISKILFLSEHTVKDHTKKIYRKLNVHSRHAAAQMLLRTQSSQIEE